MNHGLVQWIPDDKGHKCGYCKSRNESYCKGMWSYALKPQDYQSLIDRGWRRSGKYCYKPEMYKTCCPSYTIRCDALAFKPTKSHKKVLKRIHKFLLEGRKSPNDSAAAEAREHCDDDTSTCQVNESDICLNVAGDFDGKMSSDAIKGLDLPTSEAASTLITHEYRPSETQKGKKSKKSTELPNVEETHNVPAVKRKTMRKQRWLEKKSKILPMEPPPPEKPEKTLEDWLELPSGKHNLEIRLVRTMPYSKEAKHSEEANHLVYTRYQMKVHGDTKEKCALNNWKNFLVDSPLLPEEDPLLGSFHQQYWLDNRLIAVGVLDLLPLCVSSVYFYYDPEFQFLSLGTFATLYEIKLTRELHKKLPSVRYYYMGYYIHTCPKMRYKGKLPNSDLLCPEVYTWHPIENCLASLDASKYSRLEPDKSVKDSDLPTDISRALLLHKQTGYRLRTFLQQKKMPREKLVHTKEYCELVGAKIMEKIFLYTA